MGIDEGLDIDMGMSSVINQPASFRTSASSSCNPHQCSVAARPPFFQLYDGVSTKLSNAEQSNDTKAQDFYGHLKAWFEVKTEDDDFEVTNFGALPIEEWTKRFDDTTMRLAKAKLAGHGTKMIAFELEDIIKRCKRQYSVPSAAAAAPIKCEDDQYHTSV